MGSLYSVRNVKIPSIGTDTSDQNSAVPDQTAHKGAVGSGSTLFAISIASFVGIIAF